MRMASLTTHLANRQTGPGTSVRNRKKCKNAVVRVRFCVRVFVLVAHTDNTADATVTLKGNGSTPLSPGKDPIFTTSFSKVNVASTPAEGKHSCRIERSDYRCRIDEYVYV